MSTSSKNDFESFDFENDAFLSIFDDVDQPLDENESTVPVEELLSLLSKSAQDTPKSLNTMSRVFPSPIPLRDIMNSKSTNVRNSSCATKGQTECTLFVPISNSPRKMNSSIATESGRSVKDFHVTAIDSDRVEVSGSSDTVKNDNLDDLKQSSSASIQVSKSKPEDVLAIRGVGQSRNPGNIRFRELVAERKSLYDRNSDPDYRKRLGEEIVESIKPGRFLKKDDRSQRFFRIMDHEAAVTKAMFAIRDMKPSPKSRIATISRSTSSTGKRKRKTVVNSDIDGNFSKLSQKHSSSPSIASPYALTDVELEKIQEMFKDSISGIKHSRTLNRKPPRFHQIFARIESIANKVEGGNPLQTRVDLLTKVQSSMKNGSSFHHFFDGLLSQIE